MLINLLLTIDFDGAGTFTAAGAAGPNNACGCTDATAINYDSDADYDDGSCIAAVEGCTDSSACNYNELLQTLTTDLVFS